MADEKFEKWWKEQMSLSDDCPSFAKCWTAAIASQRAELKAQCAAMLEKAAKLFQKQAEEYGCAHGQVDPTTGVWEATDLEMQYCETLESVAQELLNLIPTDHAAALAEHDSDVRYIQALEIMKVFSENNVVAVWSNGARQPFHEVVRAALAEVKRQAREEMLIIFDDEYCKHDDPLIGIIRTRKALSAAAIRAEEAKQP